MLGNLQAGFFKPEPEPGTGEQCASHPAETKKSADLISGGGGGRGGMEAFSS